MADPIHLLLAKNIVRAEGGDFERFCNYLLELEVNRRHVNGRVDGHPPQYVKDGGVDILVTVTETPLSEASNFPKALTPDLPCKMAVSCKTGAKWKSLMLRDTKTRDGKKNPFIEHVETGGYVLLLVHRQVPAMEKQAFLKNFLDSLAKASAVSVEELSTRVRLNDANDLAEFFAYRPIRLDEPLRKLLAIPDFKGLDSMEVWSARQRHLRTEPDWIPDRSRTDAIDAIRALLRGPIDGTPNAIWLSGSPGVGKSRLVQEALAVDDIEQRVLAASDFQYGYEAVYAGDASRLGDGILVVDECSPDEVSGLTATFMGRSSGQSSTLILIGPPRRSGNVQFSGLKIQLEPLSPEAERALVESQVGSQADQTFVTRIVHLTEGFPWFAVLLSQAVRDDPESLPETATQWRAASLALAGPMRDFKSATEHEQEALLRAKALLAIMMTEGEAWASLTTEEEQKLSLTFEARWSDIKNAALRCFDRGLVRERQEWKYKYVTPLNVGRLAATHLLGAPHSIGSRIREHVPERRDYLYRRLQSAEMRPFDLATLAIEDVVSFEYQPTWESLRILPVSLLAQFSPAETARVVRAFIETQSVEELHARTNERRNLVFALEHVCRRKQGFSDAEHALFRLALAENETWGNNATGVWEHLFLVILALTHLPFERRVRLLERHFDTDDSNALRLACKALGQAVGQEYSGPGYTEQDKVDGEWWVPTISEARQGKLLAWRLLWTLLETKGVIKDELCELAAQHLRSSFYYGIAETIIDGLTERASLCSATGKARLREAISDVREFEIVTEEVERSLSKLASAVAPNDYHGRVLDVAGNWSPAGHLRNHEDYESLRRKEDELDQAVAREGLAGDPPLLSNELKWLSSEAATRASPFMFQVGKMDSSLRLVDGVVEHMALGYAANSFSSYLAGVQSTRGADAVDRIASRFLSNPEHMWALVLTIRRCGVNEARVGWLVELIETSKLDVGLLHPLEYMDWSNVGASVLAAFIEVLLNQQSSSADTIALNIAVSQRNRLSDSRDILEEVLVRASRGPSKGTMDAYHWERAARVLVEEGRVNAVIQAAVSLLSTTDRYAGDQEAWEILSELSEENGEEIWKAMVPVIEKRDEKAFSVALGFQSHRLLVRLPVDRIMDWVGQDEGRALWIALLCNVQSPELDEITRRLLILFGPESSPAAELAARAGSTDGVVSSIAGHAKRQAENARRWSEDQEPNVAAWGRLMIENLERSYEYHAAWEEFQDRQ
jgi:hypothetical protein